MKLVVDHRLDRASVEMRRTNRILRREVWRVVRTVSFWLERQVKIEMPVDTGRARASWGHWTIGNLRRGAKGASRLDAFYKEEPEQFEITQGSNVEYVGELEKGRSPQAPAGFIDNLAEQAQDELNRLVDNLVDMYI
jgi:hypothetical protein